MSAFKPQHFLTFIVAFFISTASIANGLYFSVKVAVSESNQKEKIEGYVVLKQTKDYLITGLFPQYIEAMKAKQNIEASGHKSIEILAFFNHTLISIEDAFSLMDNRNEQDEKNGGHLLSVQEIDEMLANVEGDEFFYTVQMGLFTEKNINDFFEMPEQSNEKVNTKGSLRYTYGNYKTYNEAKEVLTTIKEQGLEDAFIIAFDSFDRIPIERALEKEALAKTK